MHRGTMRSSASSATIIASTILSAAVWLCASAGSAQLLPEARPLFGDEALRAGFTPDPRVLQGRMGGPVAASQLNSSCRGHISSQPSHVIRSRTGFRNLRFVVSAQADATLVVMLPNGAVICDDDGGEGFNPLIQSQIPGGPIRIWVGAYSTSNVGTPYTLGITELPHITASNLSGGSAPPTVVTPPTSALSPDAPPSFGTVQLRTGFMPDPRIEGGTAGGSVQGNTVNSSCRGYYMAQPSHVIQSPTGFRDLRILVHSSMDTTLLVMTPDGQVFCDDDGGEGLNPIVQLSSRPGPVRVWVGSYSSGRTGPYSIGFSELSSIGTNSIPLPGGGPTVAVRPPSNPPPPTQPAEVVPMTGDIPVTLMGPGLLGNTIAVWSPDGQSVQMQMRGRDLTANGATLESIPSSMTDPVVTVEQRRRGALLIRAEQPPSGHGDPGQQLLLLVRWAGRPNIVERWSGTAMQRGPRWSR